MINHFACKTLNLRNLLSSSTSLFRSVRIYNNNCGRKFSTLTYNSSGTLLRTWKCTPTTVQHNFSSRFSWRRDVSVSSPSWKLWKPFMFTVFFGASSFCAISIWEYENKRDVSSRRLQRFFRDTGLKRETRSSNQDLNQLWQSLSSGQQMFTVILSLNLLVFGLWRVPQLKQFMLKYFCSDPNAPNSCLPMITSVFSHYSLFHIFANMLVLSNLSEFTVNAMGKEQFLFCYLNAGVVSSFASYCFKIATKTPGTSLGASGAIMGILAWVCFKYPQTQLHILFLPQFTFSADTAIKAIMGFDLAGCMMQWKFFDHAAHLGGAFFGIFWWRFGDDVWNKRGKVTAYYEKLRGRS